MIRPVSESLDEKMREQENCPFDSRAARAVLEDTLSYQFQGLADRLLANLALRGRASSEVWWQHYLTRAKPSESFPADSPAILRFAREFSAEIVAGRIRPMSIQELSNVEIRIFNGYTKLWDDCRINRQLRRLGSGYRIVFVGAKTVFSWNSFSHISREARKSSN